MRAFMYSSGFGIERVDEFSAIKSSVVRSSSIKFPVLLNPQFPAPDEANNDDFPVFMSASNVFVPLIDTWPPPQLIYRKYRAARITPYWFQLKYNSSE